MASSLQSRQDGFAILPEVFAGCEVDAIVGELAGQTLQRSRAGARHLLSVPPMAALARDSRLIAMAADALGCEPVPFGATLFDKSTETNWLVVWHQDTALPAAERIEPVTCAVERGGVIMMRPLLVHASSKVKVSASRRVLHLEYAAATTFDQGVRLRAS